MYLTLFYISIKKSTLTNNSITSYTLIIKNKLTTYYILNYNSKNLKNNPIKNKKIIKIIKKIYNFSTKPSILPLPILKKIQKKLLNYNKTNISIIKINHQSSYFQNIIKKTNNLLHKLINIPNKYKILFLQNNTSLQFSIIPLNLINTYKKTKYILTNS